MFEARAFPHREVANRAIVAQHHVLPAGHTMSASLQRFGWLVLWAASVSRILSGTRLEAVVLVAS